MAERKPRATKEESLNSKIASNLEAQAKLITKLEELKLVEAGLRKDLADLKNEKKKAERQAVAKAKRVAKKQAEKELMKAISKSKLSVDEIKEKLGL